MFAGKPIIGIAGGIGAGKTYLARTLGGMGCLVIESDLQVREVYRDADVRAQLRSWWGDAVFTTDEDVSRPAIAARIFDSPAEKERLEQLLHPRVALARDALMSQAAHNPKVLAFVWDTPLLFETGLYRACDAIIFLDVSAVEREQRVSRTRGWAVGELARRENLQWPLDRKRSLSHYVLTNIADADDFRIQAHRTLSRIIEQADPQATGRS